MANAALGDRRSGRTLVVIALVLIVGWMLVQGVVIVAVGIGSSKISVHIVGPGQSDIKAVRGNAVYRQDHVAAVLQFIDTLEGTEQSVVVADPWDCQPLAMDLKVVTRTNWVIDDFIQPVALVTAVTMSDGRVEKVVTPLPDVRTTPQVHVHLAAGQ